MVSIKERFANYKRAIKIASRKKQVAKVARNNQQHHPHQVKDAIIISGQPRGGTTWLAETMACDPETGIIWEPLHPKLMRQYERTQKLHKVLGDFPFIPEEAESPELVQLFNDTLTAEFLTYEYVVWPKEINANIEEKKQWIVKYCRANRILPWMVKNLDIRPPIYILRHPCAIVSSQLRHEAFDGMGTSYASDNGAHSELFEKYEPVLRNVNSRIGKLAAWWALDNVIPLSHPENNKKWITVAYEELVDQPMESFSRMYSRLGMEVPPGLLKNIDRPSSTTKPGAMVLGGGNQLEGWKKKLSNQEIHEILDVVSAFEIDVYTDALLPDYTKLYR